MNVSQDLSFLHLIANASMVVQAVMLLLLLASLASWYYIFQKILTLRAVATHTQAFEREFWSGGELAGLYRKIGAQSEIIGMERIFEAGFREYLKLQQQKADPQATVEGVRRAMRATYQREMDWLENHLSFLATVGSVSPYIGLFGTVWGIMNAFRGLSSVAQTTLAQVAPGIAEALIATAIGLFAAIPAVIAYNRFTHDIDRLDTQFDSFMAEFSNILHRQVIRA